MPPDGLDGERLPYIHLVRRIGQFHLEPLQDERDSHSRFLPGKATADASSNTISKRLPGIRRQRLEPAIQHSLRSVIVSIVAPNLRVAVQSCYAQHGDVLAFDAILAAADEDILPRLGVHADVRDSGMQSDCFPEYGFDVFELLDVLDLESVVAQHFVHLGLGTVKHTGMLQHHEESEAQQSARGVVAGKQECHPAEAD